LKTIYCGLYRVKDKRSDIGWDTILVYFSMSMGKGKNTCVIDGIIFLFV